MVLAGTTFAQTTYETGLNAQSPLDGQDAAIFSLNPNTNYGNYTDIAMSAWTYNGVPGTLRSLIRFPALAILASGHSRRQIVNSVLTFQPIKILSATLSMNAFNSGSTNWGSNYFPGTPLPNPNPCYIKRVRSGKGNAANNWREDVVTWNSAQAMTFETAPNWATIPVTSSRYDGNFAVDVTAMVQRIIDELVGTTNINTSMGTVALLPADPLANNGFLLQLQDETYYRSQFYGSSDGAATYNTPRLTITYQNNEFSCDAGFAYWHNNPADPYTVQFAPLAGPMILVPAGLYEWYIDKPLTTTAPPDATTWYHFHTFTPGTHTAWLKRYSSPGVECSRSGLITINMNADGSWTQTPEKPGPGATPEYDINNPDKPLQALENAGTFTASPNPTKSDWNISLHVSQAVTAEVSLYDIAGRKVFGESKPFVSGTNQFVTPAKELPAGIYFMELKGANLNMRQKLVKN